MTKHQPSPSGVNSARMTKRDSARSASAATQHAVDDKIVIAVDFGTTFSGVATVYSATPDEVDIIRTWPGIARPYHASYTQLLITLSRWQWNH